MDLADVHLRQLLSDNATHRRIVADRHPCARSARVVYSAGSRATRKGHKKGRGEWTARAAKIRSRATSTTRWLGAGDPVQLGRARYGQATLDRKSTRLNSSHEWISYAVFCLKKKKNHLIAVYPQKKKKKKKKN